MADTIRAGSVAPAEPESVAPAGESLIHARGLTKRFGEFTAVDGIDFDVAPGEAFGFLGPNGAGKTSTMRMIGCVSPPSGGTLRVLGRDPQQDGPEIRARLGVVPQQDTLDLELTVRENIVIYGRYFGLKRAELRERAELRLAIGAANEDAAQRIDGLAARVETLPDRLLLYTDDGDRTAHEVHELGLATSSVLVRRSTLEDVFLHLTGRTLVD